VSPAYVFDAELEEPEEDPDEPDPDEPDVPVDDVPDEPLSVELGVELLSCSIEDATVLEEPSEVW